MSNKITVILNEQGIALSDFDKLAQAFGAPYEEAGQVLSTYKNIVVTDVQDVAGMAKAREARLLLKKTRTTIENKRKELKEDIVKQGRAIDTVARLVKEEIEPAEEYLELQENFAKLKLEEEKAKIKAERTEKLLKYTNDISYYNLDTMSSEQFDTLLANLKNAYEAKLAEAKRLEEQRIADEKAKAEEAERIRQENEKLKAEAEAREKKEAEEKAIRDKAEAERVAEQAKKDAEAQAERDRIQAEADAKIEAERKKTEALEQEKRDREAEEARKKAEAEEQARKELLAPDRAKLDKLALEIKGIELPAVKSNKAQEILNHAYVILDDLAAFIKSSEI